MRSIMPEIKWIGSPFFGYPRGTKGRNGYKVIAIVNHIMAGSLAGTDAWFNNEESGGVSAHFGIGKTGAIHQYVDIGDVARHAGNVRESDWPLLMTNVNPNWYTIGIEHEGYPGQEMTEEQFLATLSLQRWLVELLNLEVTSDTIIGHSRIDSVVKANCPGPTFPWERLRQGLKTSEIKFSDVPASHWAAGAVQRVTEKGLMNGYPDGSFQGEKAVTRYELASILDRLPVFLL